MNTKPDQLGEGINFINHHKRRYKYLNPGTMTIHKFEIGESPKSHKVIQQKMMIIWEHYNQYWKRYTYQCHGQPYPRGEVEGQLPLQAYR